MNIQPRNVLCVLHDKPKLIQKISTNYEQYEYDEEYSGYFYDDRMQESFKSSDCSMSPSITDEDKKAINDHQAVSYLLLPPLTALNAIDQANKARKFVLDCFENGARAIKCESSGISHGKSNWIKLSKEESDSNNYWAWVKRPIEDEAGIMYSCGMHLLGLPDIEVIGDDALDALNIMDIFAMYLLVDAPADRLKEGHVFSESNEKPKYKIAKTACSRYDSDDFFYNPYGYWRLQKIQ